MKQLLERGDRAARAAALPARRPRPDPDPRPDRRPRPCHGPRHGRASARPLRHQHRSRRRRQRIAAYAAANPTPRWIVGRGWNQERWGLGRFPTAADLDAVVGDRPVWLERVDGHAGWANSAAMREAGITADDARRRAGGRIERTGRKPIGHLRRRRDGADRARGAAAAAAAARPRARPGAGDLAVATASPRSPTWARAPRTGR